MQESRTTPRTNWSGNHTYRAASLAQPTSIAELQHLIRSHSHLKALGTRHSFSPIADSSGTQISLSNFKSKTLDRDGKTVTLGAGVTYGELAPWVHAQGFAVPNLASLPHISVVGACATATHGSGLANQCLSTAISALQLIDGNGQLHHLSRAANPDTFPGAVVSLGALGIVTSLTLDLIPTFQIAQTVYEDLSFSELEHNLAAIFSAGYSVSLFTGWQHHRATQAWIKRRCEPAEPAAMPELFFGATRQTARLQPLPSRRSAENCTEQLGIPGPWHERLPHFRLEFTPSSGAELQSEYFVPLCHAFPAIRAVEALRDLITPHLFISEIRTIAADDLWLSMAYQRDSLAIHFTWKPEPEAVLALLPRIEAALEPFSARPHWGKLFTTPPERLRQLYPRMAVFRELGSQFDPDARFYNDFLHQTLGINSGFPFRQSAD
jgi:xylitol oxidase